MPRYTELLWIATEIFHKHFFFLRLRERQRDRVQELGGFIPIPTWYLAEHFAGSGTSGQLNFLVHALCQHGSDPAFSASSRSSLTWLPRIVATKIRHSHSNHKLLERHGLTCNLEAHRALVPCTGEISLALQLNLLILPLNYVTLNAWVVITFHMLCSFTIDYSPFTNGSLFFYLAGHSVVMFF